MSLHEDAELLVLFRDEVAERAHRLVEGAAGLVSGDLDAEQVRALILDSHTVKGSSRVMGYAAIARGATLLEEAWRRVDATSSAPQPELGSKLAELASAIAAAAEAHPLEGTPELAEAVAEVSRLVEGPQPKAPPKPAEVRTAVPAGTRRGRDPVDLGGLLSTLEAEMVEGDVRVGIAELFRLINRSAEVQVETGALRETLAALRRGAVHQDLEALAASWEQAVDSLERAVADLQQQAMALASAPLGEITDAFPRLTRYLGRKTGKDVRLEVVGDSEEVDRQVLERIADPLRHLLVNAIEHGIESPDRRVSAGKSPTGTVTVQATVAEGHLSLTVEDDGRGVDWEMVERVADARGLLTTEEELSRHLFSEGFSTSRAVSEFSGDGAGLAKLAQAVEVLNGGLTLESRPGAGTRVTVTVPAWWAMQDAMLVRAAGQQWGIPQTAVVSVFGLSEAEIRPGTARIELIHQGHGIPLASLAAAVGLPEAEPIEEVIVLATRDGEVAMTVPHIVGSQQVAVKTLGPLLAGVPYLTGAAILGGGQIAVMLDPNRIGGRIREVPPPAGARARVLVVDDSAGVRQLVAATLASHGFDTIVAGGADESLVELDAGQVDALVVDYSMPGDDGVELVKKVRRTRPELPIVMVSGEAAEEDQRRALQAGVDVYFDKSDLREGALAATLRSLLDARAVTRQAQVGSR